MSKRITLWHNPRCSKSRAALALLQESDVELEVIEYLKAPPSQKRLGEVLAMLGMSPRELARKGEAPYAELGLADASDAALLAAMVDHPILIERPVAIAGARAVVGRPPEKVLALLDER